ncbi:MAG: hypothetical protein L6R37_007225 [Teloschistes peruensis]|nr:MAG: hypothetical protein L6R37_007225 [Teloschistes peruensis]
MKTLLRKIADLCQPVTAKTSLITPESPPVVVVEYGSLCPESILNFRTRYAIPHTFTNIVNDCTKANRMKWVDAYFLMRATGLDSRLSSTAATNLTDMTPHVSHDKPPHIIILLLIILQNGLPFKSILRNIIGLCEPAPKTSLTAIHRSPSLSPAASPSPLRQYHLANNAFHLTEGFAQNRWPLLAIPQDQPSGA